MFSFVWFSVISVCLISKTRLFFISDLGFLLVVTFNKFLVLVLLFTLGVFGIGEGISFDTAFGTDFDVSTLEIFLASGEELLLI